MMLFKKFKSKLQLPSQSSDTNALPAGDAPPAASLDGEAREKESDTALGAQPTQSAADERSSNSSVHKSEPKSKVAGETEPTGPSDPVDEENVGYPSGSKLASITFALCLSVFLMALV
jgi:hypothetical protein